nr:hypothetical protein [Variovorax boronicumulans]
MPERFEPVTANTLGDVFFQQGREAVYWRNTGTAEISQVAESRSASLDLLKTEEADEWFMPNLIQDLLNAENESPRGDSIASEHPIAKHRQAFRWAKPQIS